MSPRSAGATTPGKKKKRDPRDTPAMRQYASFKASHPDCILFFRMGDFYEMFDEDARVAHAALGITLTERSTGIPMAGVPYHAADTYLRRLIEQGHRVAVCEQVQDPSEAKGVVERAVTRVLTPGTLVDDSLLNDAVSNTVAAVMPRADGAREVVDIAVAELSTGDFRLRTIPSEQALDELVRLGPSEILHDDELETTVALVAEAHALLGTASTSRPGWTFQPEEASRTLCEHWSVSSLEGYGFADADPALGAAGALLSYLLETQPGMPERHALTHLQPPKRETPDLEMALDASTVRSLELERTMRSGGTEGSLLSVLQNARTPMGRRRLRDWLCFPLSDRKAIEQRLDVVEQLASGEERRKQVRETIGVVQDVARICGRVAMRRGTPRDIVGLGRSLQVLPDLAALIQDEPALETLHARLVGTSDIILPLGEYLTGTCVDDPPAHLRDGGLVRDGIDPELDDARLLQRDGTSWLADYQQRLSVETGIPSLKIGFNKVFGYYIEVTNAHAQSVPITFNRKQTLKNAERYITPELKEYEDRVLTAEQRAIEREQQLFEDLCRAIDAAGNALHAFAETIADLDVLAGFASLALKHSLVRPTMTDGLDLEIVDGRHPVLDSMLGSEFVPNDTMLGGENAPSLALITGPNMAGKSTYIRQVALIVLMAHTGCFVPATKASIGVVDRIFTRIGASDELHAGRSTFMVEMTETANILHHATERSLVILDEIGRGTSTLDGLSLAWAITETLATRGSRTLFATHYHEITALAEQHETITNLHVAVKEWKDRIVFLHRIEEGSTNRSYGIHVAQLAGVPGQTLERARELLDTLSVETGDESGTVRGGPATGDQPWLFAATKDHPVIEELRTIDLDSMTPLEAFDRLRELIRQGREN
ncbi:MAG: DNA mismatch repair protein MutS [Phycisphaerae bacterium]|nr:DNA mismatch repair protein MutS [Phycisphaerae bacterium]